MDLTGAITTSGIGNPHDATDCSGIADGGMTIHNPIRSVSLKRRSRRNNRYEDSEITGNTATRLTAQQSIENNVSLCVQDTKGITSSITEDPENSDYNESECRVHRDDFLLDVPIKSMNILEIMTRVADEDGDATDSALTPGKSCATKTPFRAGDRLGMVAALERNRLTIQEDRTKAEKLTTIAIKEVPIPVIKLTATHGEGNKRLRQSPQECTSPQSTGKNMKKRSHINTTILTSIRQKTLTDYVTVLRQTGDSLIGHGGTSQPSDSDSLLCVVPVRAACHDSIDSETNSDKAEDSHLLKRNRTDSQCGRSAASSNSLEYDKRVAFS